MKKILKRMFGYHSISYYTRIYHVRNEPNIAYVIVLNEYIFFIPNHKKLDIALDNKELDGKLSFYRNYYNLQNK